jgi:hypothetical protein
MWTVRDYRVYHTNRIGNVDVPRTIYIRLNIESFDVHWLSLTVVLNIDPETRTIPVFPVTVRITNGTPPHAKVEHHFTTIQGAIAFASQHRSCTADQISEAFDQFYIGLVIPARKRVVDAFNHHMRLYQLLYNHDFRYTGDTPTRTISNIFKLCFGMIMGRLSDCAVCKMCVKKFTVESIMKNEFKWHVVQAFRDAEPECSYALK